MFWCCMLNVDASRIRRPTEISNMITEIINRSQNERISPVWDCLFYRLFLMLFDGEASVKTRTMERRRIFFPADRRNRF